MPPSYLQKCSASSIFKLMKYIILLTLLIASPAWAAKLNNPHDTRINLSATANAQIANDEAVIIYRLEASGNNPAKLRQQVNRMSQSIHQQLQHEKGIKQQTLSRNMQMLWRYDQRNSKQVRNGWKLVQQEQITTLRLDAVANWVDGIEQKGAHLSSLNFKISQARLQASQTKLRIQAIQKFRQQAQDMAKALGTKSFYIEQLQTNQQQPTYLMQNRKAMMVSSDTATTPSFHSGEGKISMRISGTVALPLIHYPVK